MTDPQADPQAEASTTVTEHGIRWIPSGEVQVFGATPLSDVLVTDAVARLNGWQINAEHVCRTVTTTPWQTSTDEP